MKILIDIGHPAHVHYFRNLINEMKSSGHEFMIIARNKEVTHKLLDFYGIKFSDRGKGGRTLISKFIYLIATDIKLLKIASKWKPDLFLSFGSPYAAHVAFMLKRPHIALTDTEHAKLGILSFAPFSETIITPESFWKSFKSKHIRFNGFFEMCYLHPKYYKQESELPSSLKIKTGERFVLFRFVSWNASHDIGQSGISDPIKFKLTELFLSKGYRVFISAEGRILPELEKYKININPEKIHCVLGQADFYIGEGATMASEAALLGTPSIYVNSLDAGVFHAESRYGLLYNLRNDLQLMELVSGLLSSENLKEKHQILRKNMLAETINVTDFLIRFLEKYPQSLKLYREYADKKQNLNLNLE